MPDDNYSNPSREAKHQPDLKTDYFNHLGALAWQEDLDMRCFNQLPWGQEKLAHISPFQDYPIIPNTFI